MTWDGLPKDPELRRARTALESPWLGEMRSPHVNEEPPKTIIDSIMTFRSKSELTKREKAFVEFVVFAENRSMTLPQFQMFWKGLSERQQNDFKMGYIFQ